MLVATLHARAGGRAVRRGAREGHRLETHQHLSPNSHLAGDDLSHREQRHVLYLLDEQQKERGFRLDAR